MATMTTLPLTTEHALLGFLRRSPMHGYEIHQRMSDAGGLGAVWRIKQSHLYALLGRLEKEGYVTATLERQDVRPPRKVFQLTPLGEEAFLEWVQSPVAHGRQLRLDFLVKFYFAQREGVEVASQLLQRQRLACQQWLNEQETLLAGLGNSQHYKQLVCQYRLGQIQAMLEWLDSCEQMVAAEVTS